MNQPTPPDGNREPRVRGFMPLAQGAALVEAASSVDASLGPFLEVGSYRGNSASYLGPIAQQMETVLFCVDSHRTAPERVPGWEGQSETGEPATPVDTLPEFRQTILDAELEEIVVAVVGPSPVVAKYWQRELSLVFLNGGHSEDELAADYQGWVSKLAVGGLLIIPDVFVDPEYGDPEPYDLLYIPALESGEFEELRAVESMRILRRKIAPGA